MTPFTPGELTTAQAAQLNELMRFKEQMSRLTVAAPLNISRAAGVPCISLPDSNTAWKEPVRVASTANGTLTTGFEAGDTIDGVVLVAGNRILLKDQTDQTANGIRIVQPSGAPVRAPDANTGDKLLGAVVFVSEGTTNKDTIWKQTTNATITVGTSNIVWALVSGLSTSTSSINFTFVSAVTCDADGLHVTTKTGTVTWNGTALEYSEV